jgi:two-component system, NtrC family, response regulator
MANILIIDDDELFSIGLSDVLESEGHNTFLASTLTEGRKFSQSRDMDLIFLDLQLPDGFGMDILPTLKNLSNSPEIIVITGALEEENAEIAIRKGAWDFIKKTSTQLEMKLSCLRALEYRNKRLALQPIHREGIIGNSPVLVRCLEELTNAAKTQAEVLILGETGTGKELFARALHANSPRREKELVVVDCASMTETIAGSELFGYRRGAFTGATSDKPGLILRAHGGTLFLDEISELPLSLQKSFLRVLESHTYRPLGQTHESCSNFRLVSASNRNLETMAGRGRFRKDLLYRIKTVTINIPPLRKRVEDLGQLVRYHLKNIARESGVPDMTASPDLLELFANYRWPGNVRELVNTLKALVASAPTERVLYPSHLPRDLHARFLKSRQSEASRSAGPDQTRQDHEFSSKLLENDWKTYCSLAREEYENRYLLNLMKVCFNDIQKACRHSGLSKARLYSLLKKYNITRPSKVS